MWPWQKSSHPAQKSDSADTTLRTYPPPSVELIKRVKLAVRRTCTSDRFTLLVVILMSSMFKLLSISPKLGGLYSPVSNPAPKQKRPMLPEDSKLQRPILNR